MTMATACSAYGFVSTFLFIVPGQKLSRAVMNHRFVNN